jgi:hypothetical protein
MIFFICQILVILKFSTWYILVMYEKVDIWWKLPRGVGYAPMNAEHIRLVVISFAAAFIHLSRAISPAKMEEVNAALCIALAAG